MSKAQERLLDWLRDAHAMEQQAETMLKGQAHRIENYPEVKQRIETHIEETRDQARKIENCLDRLGASTSMVKDTAGSMGALGQAIGGSMTSDEIVKGGMASFAFENLEIAMYRTLITAAKEVGDDETAAVCEEILKEEQAMADWLDQHLPGLVQQYLKRDASEDATAKR